MHDVEDVLQVNALHVHSQGILSPHGESAVDTDMLVSMLKEEIFHLDMLLPDTHHGGMNVPDGVFDDDFRGLYAYSGGQVFSFLFQEMHSGVQLPAVGGGLVVSPT